MALIDVGADLALVRTERLRRTLSVEHKRVRDQVYRGEVGFEPASTKLREVRVGWEAKDPLDQACQDWLREQLLVLPSPRRDEILLETWRAV